MKPNREWNLELVKPGRCERDLSHTSLVKQKCLPMQYTEIPLYRVAQKNRNSRFFFLGLCSNQQLSFFTLLDRASFPHYNNTKITKFGWELFILWVISYGLSFSGFAIIVTRTLEIGQIPKMTVRQSIRNYSWNEKFSTKFDDLGVIIMRKSCSSQQGEKDNCWSE